MQFWIDQLLARRKALALLTLLLGSIVALGIQHIPTDNSDRALLSEADPIRAEVEQVRRDFPPTTAV